MLGIFYFFLKIDKITIVYIKIDSINNYNTHECVVKY